MEMLAMWLVIWAMHMHELKVNGPESCLVTGETCAPVEEEVDGDA